MQLFLEVAIMKTFAEKLVARRAELGLSQAQLGELAAAGVPTEGFTVIDMWEVVR